MALFQLAIPTVLRREGGYVNNPADSGGPTNFGVSLRWLKQRGLLPELELMENHPGSNTPIADVKNMTVAEATDFYQKYWWIPAYGQMASQAVATKVFDTAVNMGAGRSARFLQQSVDAAQDGVLGPDTIARVNCADQVLLLTTFQSIQADFYKKIVLAHPNEEVFLKGWLARAFDRC